MVRLSARAGVRARSGPPVRRRNVARRRPSRHCRKPESCHCSPGRQTARPPPPQRFGQLVHALLERGRGIAKARHTRGHIHGRDYLMGRDAGLTRRNGFSPCRNRPVARRTVQPATRKASRSHRATPDSGDHVEAAGEDAAVAAARRGVPGGRLGQPPCRADVAAAPPSASRRGADLDEDQHRAVAWPDRSRRDWPVVRASRTRPRPAQGVAVSWASPTRWVGERRGGGLGAVAPVLGRSAARLCASARARAGSRRSCGLQGGARRPRTGMVFRLSCPQ